MKLSTTALFDMLIDSEIIAALIYYIVQIVRGHLFEISARFKLVSLSFSSLLLNIGNLEKSFLEIILQSYYDWQSLHRPTSYYILVSFGETDPCPSVILAKTERYDIFGFSEVTTKSLASQTGS